MGNEGETEERRRKIEVLLGSRFFLERGGKFWRVLSRRVIGFDLCFLYCFGYYGEGMGWRLW